MELDTAPVFTAPEPAPDAIVTQPSFYVVSARKLLLLSLITGTVYSIYWFYKNWSLQRQQSAESIWPVARAIFSIFFVQNLFKRVDTTLEKIAPGHDWSPGALAMGYVLVTMGGNVANNIASHKSFSYLDVLLIPQVILTTYFLYRAQLAINQACGDRSGSSNDKLSWANYAWLAAGTVQWLLILIFLYVGIWHPELLEAS